MPWRLHHGGAGERLQLNFTGKNVWQGGEVLHHLEVLVLIDPRHGLAAVADDDFNRELGPAAGANVGD
jgi:hypothetical protein